MFVSLIFGSGLIYMFIEQSIQFLSYETITRVDFITIELNKYYPYIFLESHKKLIIQDLSVSEIYSDLCTSEKNLDEFLEFINKYQINLNGFMCLKSTENLTSEFSFVPLYFHGSYFYNENLTIANTSTIYRISRNHLGDIILTPIISFEDFELEYNQVYFIL